MALNDVVNGKDLIELKPDDAVYLDQGRYARTAAPLEGYFAIFTRQNGESADAVVALFGKDTEVSSKVARHYADEVRQLFKEHPFDEGFKMSGVIIYRKKSGSMRRTSKVKEVLNLFKKTLDTVSIRATGFGGNARLYYDFNAESWNVVKEKDQVWEQTT